MNSLTFSIHTDFGRSRRTVCVSHSANSALMGPRRHRWRRLQRRPGRRDQTELAVRSPSHCQTHQQRERLFPGVMVPLMASSRHLSIPLSFLLESTCYHLLLRHDVCIPFCVIEIPIRTPLFSMRRGSCDLFVNSLIDSCPMRWLLICCLFMESSLIPGASTFQKV